MKQNLNQVFQGKVAMVAGASKGIGAGTALAFAELGVAVAIGARSVEGIENIARAIEARGGQALPIVLDVGDEESMQHFVDEAVRQFGRLDFAFNNASAGPRPGPLAEINWDDFDRSIRTHIRGTFLGMKHQIKAMRVSGGGAIVNMASYAGLVGTSGLAAYVAGKSGIIGLSKAAALDYADHNIRINVLAPGPILTHHLEQAGEEIQRQAAMSTPMRKLGSITDIANAVLWLCSPEAGFITGIVLPIDGGQSAGHKLERAYEPGRPGLRELRKK